MLPKPQHFTYTSSDKQQLHSYYWPAAHPRALLYLIHGMSEHGKRYQDFAEFLNRRNISVLVPDQRGFGKSIVEGQYGHFGDQAGWSQLLADHDALWQQWLNRVPNTSLPVFIMGHSMGSYVAQHVVQRHPEARGLILSGSGRANPTVLRLARLNAWLEKLRLGKRGYSNYLDKLSFASFNSAFKPNRTAFDWLSRDPIQVDHYVADQLCGGLCTNQFWLDFLGGMLALRAKNLAKIEGNLPILITGGSDDPASGEKGLARVHQAYGESGHSALTLKVYSAGRHEMLNEINRSEVFEDITQWLETLINL